MISEVFNAMKGVLGMAPDIILSASACFEHGFLFGLPISVVYINLHVLGLILHMGPTAPLHCIRDVVAFLVILMIC